MNLLVAHSNMFVVLVSVGADYIHCTGEETTLRLTARVSRGKNTVFLLQYRFSLYT
ncbi:hypothetical protein L208DRAFT_1393033 [Tricholoma matsutake]|nr:hypothetical protein L208DRAFT_1393033 [Tricholoma matsutake 945]